MRAEGPAVLGSEERCLAGREVVPQQRQFRCVEGIGDTSAQEAQAGGVEADRCPVAQAGRNVGGGGGGVVSWQMMEQRQVRRNKISVRREMRLPQGLEPGEGIPVHSEGQDQGRGVCDFKQISAQLFSK